mgnify:FL=1
MSKLKITHTRSNIGRISVQRETLKHLGLRKISQSVVIEDTPVVRGMIKRVEHMVKVESVED